MIFHKPLQICVPVVLIWASDRVRGQTLGGPVAEDFLRWRSDRRLKAVEGAEWFANFGSGPKKILLVSCGAKNQDRKQ